MVVEEIQRQQEQAIPRLDLSAYAGQWVALRGDEVIASDVDAVALRSHLEVVPTDVLLLVPDAGADLLLL